MPHAVNYYTLAVKSKKPQRFGLQASDFGLQALGLVRSQKPGAWSHFLR